MPSGLIENDQGMSAAFNSGADLVQMCLHGVRVAPGHDETGAFPFCRADGAENISPLCALIMRGAGTRSSPRPAAGNLVFLPNSGFILEPDFYLRASSKPVLDRRQRGGEVFLKFSMACSSCA